VLNVGGWNMNLLVAERYMQDRVLLAGDAIHLVIPNGGLGLNTGIGDAIDVSWKLAATLDGWGGPGLLPSYEQERRPIGLINRDASGRASAGVRAWMAACGPHIAEDTPEGRANREQVIKLASVGQRVTHEMNGIELGYRYQGSPLIFDEPGESEPQIMAYRPLSWPGARLPHMWLADGRALHDLIADNCYTLLCLGSKGDAGPLARAMGALGAPFAVLALDEPALRAAWQRDFLLLRPDLHVAWRGNALPDDARAVAARVTGHAS